MLDRRIIEGLDGLEKSLLDLENAVGVKILRSVLNTSAKPVVDAMIELAPVLVGKKTIRLRSGEVIEVDGGYLKKNIKRKLMTQKKATRNGEQVAAITVGVRKTKYAGHVEYGTSNQGAQSYIRAGWENTREQALTDISRKLKLRIERGK